MLGLFSLQKYSTFVSVNGWWRCFHWFTSPKARSLTGPSSVGKEKGLWSLWNRSDSRAIIFRKRFLYCNSCVPVVGPEKWWNHFCGHSWPFWGWKDCFHREGSQFHAKHCYHIHGQLQWLKSYHWWKFWWWLVLSKKSHFFGSFCICYITFFFLYTSRNILNSLDDIDHLFFGYLLLNSLNMEIWLIVIDYLLMHSYWFLIQLCKLDTHVAIF